MRLHILNIECNLDDLTHRPYKDIPIGHFFEHKFSHQYLLLNIDTIKGASIQIIATVPILKSKGLATIKTNRRTYEISSNN